MNEFEANAYEIFHEGTKRHSGRYPWGSGDNPYQRSINFLGTLDKLKKDGLSEREIWDAMGLGYTGKDEAPLPYNSTRYRALKSIAVNAKRAEESSQAVKLRDKGVGATEIARIMGLKNESSVRSLLAYADRDNANILESTSNVLKNAVNEKGVIDIGRGSEQLMGVTKSRLDTSVAMLKEEGYQVMYIKEQQLGTGKFTSIKVLVPPGTEYKDVVAMKDKIGIVGQKSDDGGRTFNLGLRPPQNVDQSRLAIRYAEEGGTDMDGVMELRRGVSDLDIGGGKYAQVRISIDGTHYLKGMAVYSDDLPPGVDIRFNTNKSDTGNKLDALKPMKTTTDAKGNTIIDMDNPFGAAIKPGGQRGALNIISEEGDWNGWSSKLSSQFLSKQNPDLIKSQLDLTSGIKREQLDEIMSLTNPEVKKKMLQDFADAADGAAVHLKAAGLPRTATHVLLPVPSMKENEIFAPQYRDGEKVVLVRHPHGGVFEIPELTVNNKNRKAKSMMDQALDAVGIHPKAAEQLSGADFDGDTVLVIPQSPAGKNRVLTKAPLAGLKNFDPKRAYPGYEGMKEVDKPGGGTTQQLMGDISNLITDMTIKGAPIAHLERAVRHSMVVIDAKKHKLDWRLSEKDNRIKELKAQYQLREDGKAGGASTLISRASSDMRVNARRLARVGEGGAIDPKTGLLRYVDTGEGRWTAKHPSTGKKVTLYEDHTDSNYWVTKKDKATGKVDRFRKDSTNATFEYNLIKSSKMAETTDARTLSSGTRRENLYADYANRMKSMANEARKELVVTKSNPLNKEAARQYKPEVETLRAKLNLAKANAPLERKAQLVGNAIVKAKQQAKPHMDSDELKKIKGQALLEARRRTGALKQRVDFTDKEWEAVQKGAISKSMLNELLAHADMDRVKALATPRDATAVSSAKMARAKQMLARGYQQSEIAAALGIPTSTLNDNLRSEGVL